VVFLLVEVLIMIMVAIDRLNDQFPIIIGINNTERRITLKAAIELNSKLNIMIMKLQQTCQNCFYGGAYGPHSQACEHCADMDTWSKT